MTKFGVVELSKLALNELNKWELWTEMEYPKQEHVKMRLQSMTNLTQRKVLTSRFLDLGVSLKNTLKEGSEKKVMSTKTYSRVKM